MSSFFSDFLDSVGGVLGDNPELWGSIGGALLGSLDSEGPTQTTRPFFLDGQEQGLVDFMDLAKQEYAGGPRPYFPENTVAALDPNTIAGQNAALGATGVQQQLADVGAFAAGELAGGGAGFVEGFDLPAEIGFGLDPSLESAITNPIMRELQQKILPSIEMRATGQGAFGGTRMQQMQGQAGAEATERMTDALVRGNLEARGQSIAQREGDISSMLQGRNQDINQNQLYNSALESGVRGVTAAQASQLQPAQTQMDIGAQRTGYEQELIGADMDRFNFMRDEPQNALSLLGQRLTMQQPVGARSTTETPSNIGTILGGALTGSQLLGGIFSGQGSQAGNTAESDALIGLKELRDRGWI